MCQLETPCPGFLLTENFSVVSGGEGVVYIKGEVRGGFGVMRGVRVRVEHLSNLQRNLLRFSAS